MIEKLSGPAQFPPRVCIAGMGGIGGLLAAHLNELTLDLSVVARGETLRVLRHEGLYCSNENTTSHHRLQADSRAPDTIQDLIILCGKYHQLSGLLDTVKHAIGPHTKIIPVVNGFPWWMAPPETQAILQPALDPEGTLSQLSRNTLCGCVAYTFAQVEAPGHIRVAGIPHFTLGDVEKGSGCTEDILNIFHENNSIFHRSEDIRRDLWAKLSLNVSTNPLSVMFEASLHELTTSPDAVKLALSSLNEMQNLGRAYGLSDLPPTEALMSKIVQGGRHPTSMLQDYRHNRPLELSAMGDAILLLARHYNVSMPVTETVLTLTRRKAAIKQNLSAAAAYKD